MPVTIFLLLRTFSIFGTMTQHSLTDYSIQFSLPNLLPPLAIETVPRFCPQPCFSHNSLFLPDLTYFPGFPISVSSPGFSLALQVNTRHFHKDVPLKMPNVPNPSSYIVSPSCSSSCHSFTHTHAYTFSEHLSWDQTLC